MIGIQLTTSYLFFPWLSLPLLKGTQIIVDPIYLVPTVAAGGKLSSVIVTKRTLMDSRSRTVKERIRLLNMALTVHNVRHFES